MRNDYLTPLMRSTVGFDRMASLLDNFARADDHAQTYPPYNIEKLSEETYRISMAVAGFSEDELNIVTQGTTLFVSGKARNEDDGGIQYLYQRHRAARVRAALRTGRAYQGARRAA